MDEQLSKKSSEPEDCVEYFKRHEVGEEIYRNRANGDDAGYVEDIEEEENNVNNVNNARPD